MSRQLLQHKQEIITSPHQRIHEGRHFESSWKSPEGSDISDNASYGLYIQTKENEAHFTFQMALGGDLEIRFWRDATFSASGTVNPAFNLNHTSGMTPTTALRTGPTLVTGTLFLIILQPGGTGPSQSVGGTAPHDIERELRTGTAYYLQGINRSGSSQPGSVLAYWYEEGE